MVFNLDLIKQAQEVIFNRKLNKPLHPNLTFNNSHVSETESQKHLGLILDNKLNFSEHLKDVFDKISKTIGLIRIFQLILPRFSLLSINKTFVRPHFDYGDIIYDQTYKVPFHRKLEYIQYSASLAITSTIRGTSYEKLNQEIDLKTPQSREWLMKLMKSKYTFLKNSYIPSAIIEWNKQDQIYIIQKSRFYLKTPISFIRPEANSIFNIHNAKGIKLLTRLRFRLLILRNTNFDITFKK